VAVAGVYLKDQPPVYKLQLSGCYLLVKLTGDGDNLSLILLVKRLAAEMRCRLPNQRCRKHRPGM